MPSVTVLYFASIREQLGRSEDRIDITDPCPARELWQRVAGRPLPANTLVAINRVYAEPDAQVQPGDELAFFPPVTGG